MPPPKRQDDSEMLRFLGRLIQEARRQSGITQERLAELVGISPRSIQRIEAGSINSNVTTVLRIQRALGCNWDELLGKPSR